MGRLRSTPAHIHACRGKRVVSQRRVHATSSGVEPAPSRLARANCSGPSAAQYSASVAGGAKFVPRLAMHGCIFRGTGSRPGQTDIMAPVLARPSTHGRWIASTDPSAVPR